jgi:methylphosphotriester-DNA--protein-cysteine methyltransferase
VFRETIGVSPKTFAEVTRFRRAVRAAREENHAGWATIAAGYYDQAHLITEFRAIAGVTPRAHLGELHAAQYQSAEPRRRVGLGRVLVKRQRPI